MVLLLSLFERYTFEIVCTAVKEERVDDIVCMYIKNGNYKYVKKIVKRKMKRNIYLFFFELNSGIYTAKERVDGLELILMQQDNNNTLLNNILKKKL